MRTSRAATLKNVAEEAGVSTVAVSVVLNGSRSNVGVSPATRQRIIDTAARLQYRPNAVARSLRRRSTNIIGFYSGADYAPARGGAFLSQIIAGLQDACDTHSKDLLIHGTSRSRSVDDIYLELASGTIDGLVLHAPGNDALVSQLSNASLPCIVIASPVETLPSVTVDDRQGMDLLTEYLYQKGHRFVAFRHSFLRHTSARRRAEAFDEAAKALGMRVVVTTPATAGGYQLSAEEETLLALPAEERPSVVVNWNDTTAHAFLADAQQRGVRVPEDIAVTGFDGFPSLAVPRWNLTTVHAPWREVSQTAVRLLVARINGEEIPQETCLPVTLQIGDTA